MSYTASEIITIAQRLLVDIDDDAYLDDMLAYFNEWQRRFAVETQCVQSVKQIAVTSPVLTYASIAAGISGANDIITPFQVRLDSGVQYSFLPKNKLSDLKDLPLASVILPTRYAVFGKQLTFDLMPTATISFNATISCSFIPDDLTATSEGTLIPDQWAQAGVHYLCYCARIADRDAGLANGHYSEYEAMRVQAAALYAMQMEA
jgi:hypothetical protein